MSIVFVPETLSPDCVFAIGWAANNGAVLSSGTLLLALPSGVADIHAFAKSIANHEKVYGSYWAKDDAHLGALERIMSAAGAPSTTIVATHAQMAEEIRALMKRHPSHRVVFESTWALATLSGVMAKANQPGLFYRGERLDFQDVEIRPTPSNWAGPAGPAPPREKAVNIVWPSDAP